MTRTLKALVVCLLAAGPLSAANPPALMTAQGTIERVERDQIVVKPRGETGRFEAEVTLHLTGTSKLSVVKSQTRAGKSILVQNEITPDDLRRNQPIAVIYTEGPSGPVLLAAVVQPPSGK